MIRALLIFSLRNTSEGDVANPEHVKIVEQARMAISAWRMEHPDERMDLNRADLSGARLSGANLSEATLIRANLNEATLIRANLSGARLSGANLSRANLSEATLSRANLSEATLSRTHLSGARLSGANLSGANLSGANLSGARLSGATLSGATLSRAHLSGADLSEATLIGAKCGATVFANVDLSSAISLETIVHLWPSTIGVDTLCQSDGKIPEAFLRGCGVPEDLITYLPALTGQPFQFYSCFISYSHEDKSFARRLHDGLQGRGVRCWLDEHQVLPGDDLYEQVDRGIRLWDKVLLCCSEASLTSWWVEREIDRAFKKEMELKKDRGVSVLAIIPLDLDGHFMSWDHPHAAALQKRMAADFTDWETNNAKFEQQFEGIVEALRADDGGREPAPESRLPR